MNKYFALLFICSGLYAQNPAEKSAFDKNLARANAEYEKLADYEKTFCDLGPRRLAVMHVRKEKDADLIPTEISKDEEISDSLLSPETRLAVFKISVHGSPEESKARFQLIGKISAIRISAPFKRKADAVGKKPTWHFFEQHNFDDPNYFDTAFGEKLSSTNSTTTSSVNDDN